MRYLSIDYGAKWVGLALSDKSGRIAFPESILENKAGLVARVAKLCVEKRVGKIVLGESLNFRREPNPIMAEINKFKERLATATNLEIIFELEWLTSALAARSSGKDDQLDDSAAALILQTYLDRL